MHARPGQHYLEPRISTRAHYVKHCVCLLTRICSVNAQARTMWDGSIETPRILTRASRRLASNRCLALMSMCERVGVDVCVRACVEVCVCNHSPSALAQSAHLPSTLKKKRRIEKYIILSRPVLFHPFLPLPSPPPFCVQCAQLAASLDAGVLDEIDMVVRSIGPHFPVTLFFFKP